MWAPVKALAVWLLYVVNFRGLIMWPVMGGRLCRPLRRPRFIEAFKGSLSPPLHGRLRCFIYQHTIFHHNYI